MRRSAVGVCAALWLVVLMVAGCSGGHQDMPSEADLKVEADELGQSLLAQIDGVERTQDDLVSNTNRYGTISGARTDEHDPRWRVWRAQVTFTPEAELSPKHAAERIGEVLDSDPQWSYTFTDTNKGGSREYRREAYGDNWYVELTYSEQEPPMAQNLTILVVSPTTTRD